MALSPEEKRKRHIASTMAWRERNRDEIRERELKRREMVRAGLIPVDHGTVKGYARGCRCEACRKAKSEEYFAYTKRKRQEAMRHKPTYPPDYPCELVEIAQSIDTAIVYIAGEGMRKVELPPVGKD